MNGFLAVLLVLAVTLLGGDARSNPVTVYHCAGYEGVEYADTPCGSDAQTLKIITSSPGGNSGAKSPPPTPPVKEQAEPDATSKVPERVTACREFQSTNLRRLLIREQVVQGMTRAQVRRAWGTPVEAYTEPVEMWIYDMTYYGRLLSVTRVYFEQGCVTTVDTTGP